MSTVAVSWRSRAVTTGEALTDVVKHGVDEREETEREEEHNSGFHVAILSPENETTSLTLN